VHSVLPLFQNRNMKKQESEKEKSDILRRYCENRYTAEDLETVLSWFGEPRKDIILRVNLNNIWSETANRDISESQTSYKEDHMLGSIHHRINLLDTEKTGIRLGVKKERNFFYFFSRVAAILFIPLLAASLIFLSHKTGIFIPEAELKYTELHAPPFARISFYLADSTKVWLNNGSSLKYPIDFTGRDRKVFLHGEAYFDVRPNPNLPFKVETGDIRIQVLGTRFNVSNYKEDQAIITTLEEGMVQIRTAGEDKNSMIIHELIPSHQSVFQKESRKVKARTVNTAKYTSWKEGKLFLLDDPMYIVKKKIERWYNVDIVIKDSMIQDYRYTGTFQDEPLESVLRMMTIATPIKYSIKKGIKQPDNTYSKDTIIIRKK